MKKRHRSPITTTLLAAAIFCLATLPALAQNPPFTPGSIGLDNFGQDISVNQNTLHDQLQLTVMPYPNAPLIPEQGNGDFVGLTIGYISDLTLGETSDAFYMFCVDFNHEIFPATTYDTVIESLANPGPPFPNPTPINEPLATLQLQAILGGDFGSSPSGNAPFDTEVQDDIWNLDILPPNPLLPVDTQGQLAAAILAMTKSPNFNNSYVFDVTPPNGGPGQAFMPVTQGGFNTQTSSTPEPGTVVMFGLGLIGLGSLKLRRSRR